MRNLFNIVMRIVSSLLGVLLVCMGGVWILQGLDLAFKVGFMVGDKQWVAWGALLALVGVAQVVWSNTRQTPA
jgi:drug/metabolite transporter superfamily protein YnfA